jgi:hypothetical protein
MACKRFQAFYVCQIPKFSLPVATAIPQSFGENVLPPSVSLPTKAKEFLFWIFVREMLAEPVSLL